MPRRAAAFLVIVAALFVPAPAAAQGPVPDPPGPYVFDLQGATSALPEGAGFFPPLAANTPVPSRGLGFNVGAHVYMGRLGPARLGVGASLLQVRGEEKPITAADATTAPPGLQVRLRSIAPQLSFNFGTATGWSYLSAGAGVSTLVVKATEGVEAERNPGSVMTINMGGGARWFITDRMAFGFDVRLYRLAAADTLPAGMLFAVAAGVSLR